MKRERACASRCACSSAFTCYSGSSRRLKEKAVIMGIRHTAAAQSL